MHFFFVARERQTERNRQRNNKLCQSSQRRRSSYLSLQSPQMLSISLLLLLSLNDSDIHIFSHECSDSVYVCLCWSVYKI